MMPSDNDGGRYVRGSRYVLQQSSTARAEKLHCGDRKELRQGTPRADTRGGSSRVIHVRRHTRPSWFTSEGVARKVKILDAKGIPNMQNWRLLTLTVRRNMDEENPHLPYFTRPLAAYLAGKKRIERFLEGCRRCRLWKKGTPWAWKFEFHSDAEGYPHWHVVVGHKYKMTRRQFDKLNELWKLGRVNVKRIRDSKFGYTFKYAMKPVLIESPDPEGDPFERLAPDWFLDYFRPAEVSADGQRVRKPGSFQRVRFWQTSKGFYRSPGPSVEREKKEPTMSYLPAPVRLSMDRVSRTVQVVARKWDGRYVKSALVPVGMQADKFWDLVGFDVVHGRAVGLGVYSYVVPTDRLEQNNKQNIWLVNQIQKRNRLTLPLAHRLQRERQTLRTC